MLEGGTIGFGGLGRRNAVERGKIPVEPNEGFPNNSTFGSASVAVWPNGALLETGGPSFGFSPFQKGEIKDIFDTIEWQKSLFCLALQMITCEYVDPLITVAHTYFSQRVVSGNQGRHIRSAAWSHRDTAWTWRFEDAEQYGRGLHRIAFQGRPRHVLKRKGFFNGSRPPTRVRIIMPLAKSMNPQQVIDSYNPINLPLGYITQISSCGSMNLPSFPWSKLSLLCHFKHIVMVEKIRRHKPMPEVYETG